MKKWLVTGGAGFIGSHVCDNLIKNGDKVVVLDDLSTGFIENLNPRIFDFIRADVKDEDVLKKLVPSVDGVFHLAATVSVQDCIKSWISSHETNIGATIKIFDIAKSYNIPVVYASSAAVYGNVSGIKCAEKMQPQPLSPYGADKLACEYHARSMYDIHNLPSFGLRFFNVYGPRQNPTSPYSGVMSIFFERLSNQQEFTIYGDGHQSRDFIYVTDVAQTVVSAMQHLLASNGCFVSNVCTGNSISLLDLIDILAKVKGLDNPEIDYQPQRKGDIQFSQADNDRFSKMFPNIQPLTLAEGINNYFSFLDSEN